MNRSLCRVIGALVALAICAAGASAALAGGGATTKSATQSIPAGAMTTQVGAAKATCPKGSVPVPAGLSTSKGAKSTVLGLSASGRTAKATLGNYADASRKITSIAYCAAAKGLKVRVGTNTTIDSVEIQHVTASCEEGERLLFGGFKLPKTTDVYLAGLKKEAQKRWTVAVLAFEPDEKITSFAYCSEHAPRTTTVSKSYTVPNNQTTSATPKCPKGKVAVGGGYESQVTVSDEFGLLRATKRAGSRGWKTTVRDDNGENRPPDVTAYAYCAE
jgi:hypothetical protein